MGNLADIIEKFILHKLAREHDDIVILKRNEIAEEIECAPSQVSYVLSTRFTIERGFIVESRRGMGGYVRIARIPMQTYIYEDAAQQIDNQTSFDEVIYIVKHLNAQGLLTAREGLLITQFFSMIYDKVSAKERGEMLRKILLSLAQG